MEYASSLNEDYAPKTINQHVFLTCNGKASVFGNISGDLFII